MVLYVSPTPEIAVRLVRMERLAFPDRKTPWSAEDYQALGTSPGGLILSDDTVSVGFLVLRLVADEGEILDLGVVPQARRQGVARALLNQGMAVAAQRGIDQVFLDVAEDNLPARALYEGAGFSITGRRPQYYARQDGGRMDALLMSLQISPLQKPSVSST